MGRRNSEIWNHFSYQTNASAKCNYCSAIISIRAGSSSPLLRHFRTKHDVIPYARHESVITTNTTSSTTTVSMDSTSSKAATCSVTFAPSGDLVMPAAPAPERSQSTLTNYLQIMKPMQPKLIQTLDRQLVKMIVKEGHPLSIVSDPEFQAFIKMLSPTYSLPSKQTVRDSLIPKYYNEVSNNLKLLIKEAKAVCLTTDSWTSRNNESYIAITAHWMDEDFKLKAGLLSCAEYEERHTGENLKQVINSEILEWGIKDKICCIVSDNAANIKATIELGNWKHLPCFAHTLNLVAQAATKTISGVVSDVKDIVKFFKKSTVAMNKLKKTMEEKGLSNLKLLQECPTRWNSTFLMLERFLLLKEAVFSTLVSGIVDGPMIPTSRTVKIIEGAIRILKPFYLVTKEMEAEKHVTVSKILPFFKLFKSAIQFILDNNLESEPKEIQELCRILYLELNRRSELYEKNKIVVQATLLDPRFKKLGFLDSKKADAAVLNLKQTLLKCSTANECDENQLSEVTEESSAVESDTSFIWASFDEDVRNQKSYCSASKIFNATVEVDKYLGEPMLTRKEDPLKWWWERRTVYPHLAPIAVRRLCVMATSVPCERVFSKTGEIISERRSRLKSKKVSELIFLQQNFV